MHVIAVQHDIAWNDPAGTVAGLSALLDDVQIGRGGLMVFPEAFATGFVMDPDAGEAPDGPAHQFQADLARRRQGHVLAGLLRQLEPGRSANEAVLLSPAGELVGGYRKQKLFTPAGEHEVFEPGEGGFSAEVDGMRIAPLICYDLRFPELFRPAALDGVEVLIVLANWPAVRADHWRALLIARAIENQAYVVGVNRVGRDPRAEYAGGSIVIGPDGQPLAEAGQGEQLLSVTLSPATVADHRRDFPALRDARRPG
jgi:predicted amidohydrolase